MDAWEGERRPPAFRMPP
jgi:hypothetical protein